MIIPIWRKLRRSFWLCSECLEFVVPLPGCMCVRCLENTSMWLVREFDRAQADQKEEQS